MCNSSNDLKMDAGKCAGMAKDQGIFVTQNDKSTSKAAAGKADKRSSVEALIGLLPGDTDADAARAERFGVPATKQVRDAK